MTKKVFDCTEVARRRGELNLSRQELAERCGMKRVATIREIELGAVPRGNTIGQLAAGLGCGVEELYRDWTPADDANDGVTKETKALVLDEADTLEGFDGGTKSKPFDSAPSSPGAQ